MFWPRASQNLVLYLFALSNVASFWTNINLEFVTYTWTRYLVSERDICLHLINVDSLYVVSVDIQSSIVDVIGDDENTNAIRNIHMWVSYIYFKTPHFTLEERI